MTTATAQSSPRRADARTLDVLGVCPILPLDYSFILGHRTSLANAKRVLKHIDLPFQPSLQPGFRFRSLHVSGGGKIPNVLSYLGQSGRSVEACGAVGDDQAGRDVVADLQGSKVGTSSIRVVAEHDTRVVFIVHKPGSKSSHQVHRKGSRQAKLTRPMLLTAPSSRVLLLGRANAALVDFARGHRSQHTMVAFHLASVPWRAREREDLEAMLRTTDLLVSWFSELRKLVGTGSNDAAEVLRAVSGRFELPLVVSLEEDKVGVRSHAYVKGTGSTLSTERTPRTDLLDPTGMMDTLHGAFLSFLLAHQCPLDDLGVIRAALSFAHGNAMFNATGVGARHFPAPERRQQLWQSAKDGIETRQRCFISHASSETPFARRLEGAIESAPGIEVWLNNILGGQPLKDAIADGVARANAFLLLLTSASLESDWVAFEVQKALEDRDFRQIIPLLIDGGAVSGLLKKARRRWPVLFKGPELLRLVLPPDLNQSSGARAVELLIKAIQAAPALRRPRPRRPRRQARGGPRA